ncbi:hypothetical protein SAMN04490181_3881 [Pseudomonas brenneri]|jgi:hypothetical protein|uniref:Uncharacterized protein n=1 Tax=Pseudomonas brenneri TaxID=129817 RepID=A0ABY0WGM5_9PSED|nr:hypothetical protein SAMN04490181_3881 [Pseudomonas brenneri]
MPIDRPGRVQEDGIFHALAAAVLATLLLKIYN